MPSLANLEAQIHDYIVAEGNSLDSYTEILGGRKVVWLVKYLSSNYLKHFLSLRKMRISTSRGFTWGDAVYAAPLMFPYSSMIYGRAGIVGYINRSRIARIFRADQLSGIQLYHQWITFQSHWFKMLTTTTHADHANRKLRNVFRRRFAIDLVILSPDQSADRYTDVTGDRWFAISDWGNFKTGFSDLVEDCKWLAIVGEDFKAEDPPIKFMENFGVSTHSTILVDGPGSGSNAVLHAIMKNYHGAAMSGKTKVALIRTES
jgi:hypothetical protein